MTSQVEKISFRLSKEDLIKKAEFFVASGSDMIDIGMIAGEDRSDEIPDLIDTLRPIVGDRPLSIDTLNPKEIEAAVNHGIDMVLSLDNGNYEDILPLLKEKNVPAVILPTNFSAGYVPHTPEDSPGLHQGRKLRQVRPLPDRHQAFAGDPGPHRVR